ncbi:Methanogenic corrinoid protein MtbC1 [Micromonospora nigra]|uniref:Methanogenic corrinoid protein MtbC1 n=1 Tax=Micromonospora nigra TaxID=145857 RepID=A0A1C6RMM4_9ACTN|nr:cobalamin-dependent protein [Micromonospora nigra]SCL18359.1 Methanogenic corrinoid protein MtbC1 [Micromonospora nigra]
MTRVARSGSDGPVAAAGAGGPGAEAGGGPAAERGPVAAPGRETTTGAVPAAAVEAYLEHLDRADDSGAVRLALGLLDAGHTVADVLVDLVSVAQREVGQRWLTGRWSVAQEHAATHIAETVVGAVAARTPSRSRRGHVVMACVEGEWHSLAARIVAEVVRADGWRVTFLGASVPARHLVSFLHQTGPDAVLLSCVQPSRLVRAARVVEACRAAGVAVVAGGPGFGADGRWAPAVGAYAWGASARDAARLLVRHPPVDAGAPPTAATDEHVVVLRRRREVVEAALRAVDPPEREVDALATSVAHLVDALAAALRVDDVDLLLDFTAWQSAAMAHRHAGRDVPEVVLATCAAVLAAHPRGVAFVNAARRAAPGRG